MRSLHPCCVGFFIVACASHGARPDPAVDASGPRVATWGDDVALTTTTSNAITIFNFGRAVAASSGRVHATWEQDGTGEVGGSQVYYARSTDAGATWATPIRLSTGGTAAGSTIAALGDLVIVAFNQVDQVGGVVKATFHIRRSLDGGATWLTEQAMVSTGGGSSYGHLAIAGDRVHVVWCEAQASGYPEVVTARSLDRGQTWEAPTTISSSPASPSWVPTVHAQDDLVLVGWVDYQDANEEEYLRRSTDGGATWGPIQRLTNDSADSWAPSIATQGNDVYFSWFDRRDSSATDVDVENALDAALTLVGLSYPPIPPRDPTVYYLQPFIARLDQKFQALTAAAPTWVRGGGDPAMLQQLVNTYEQKRMAWTVGWELYLKLSHDGGATWGPDTRLTSAPGLSTRPSIVAVNDEVHVVWFDGRDSTNGDQTEVYYKASSDRGQSWTDDLRLTQSGGKAQLATLAIDQDALHVVWSDQRSGPAQAYYKRATLAP
jgi:hypothetical protein